MPTNFENWQIYTRNLTSPQTYIDFGYYFLITSALQRRVWFSHDPWRVFCNFYTVLVGPPATGKGLVIGAVNQFLKYHRINTGQVIKTSIGDEKPLLFPNGADCITFEQLMSKLASSARGFATPDKKPYIHTSMWFALEELASIFKHKTDDVVRFLQNAYDGKDYDYEIKHQEKKDRIRNLCLSFLAGTQAHFLTEAQKKGIFDQGWASRVVFIFESQPRFVRFHIADALEEDQIQAQKDLLDWIKKLSMVYGQITYSPETREYLEDYYLNVAYPKIERGSPRYAEYMGRIKMHIWKVAAALHFSENLELVIPLETMQLATKLLENLDKNVEAGLSLIGKNPYHQTVRQMLKFIRARKEVPESELILAFATDMNITELMLCIRELELGFNLKFRLKGDGKKMYYL